MSLSGPHAADAYDVIENALIMSRAQAIRLSQAYEADPNESYLAHCAMVQDALAVTGRGIDVSWLTDAFRYQDWTADTKALHAVADAAMAILVADVVPASVVYALARPWISQRAEMEMVGA